MELFERENYLQILEDKFNHIVNGDGLVVLISGEAGIGKTSLVEKFIENKDVKIYWGACDSLNIPRPLGPLYDIAIQSTSNLFNLLVKNEERHVIFSSTLQLLHNRNQPVLMIIEDIHWADESTIDLIKFLGKRINQEKALLIVTFRDDEVGSGHPARTMFGDIPQKNILRMNLIPLSEHSIESIAELNGVNSEGLYEKTNGNPFFITEIIAAKDENIPLTIKDSILAKLSRLSEKAKNFIELISVIPGKIDLGFIKELISYLSILDECIETGKLKRDFQYITFKHELVRLSIEESLPESKKEKFNSQLLNILLQKEEQEKNYANIVHHAVNANDKNVIIKYAPLAAKQSSKLGSHTQAAKYYLSVLQYSEQLFVEEQLDLLEGRCFECYLTGQIDEGIKACESIIKLLEKHSYPYREGENYRRLSRLLWYAGEDLKSEECLYKAIEILEKQLPGRELAMTYSNLSQLYMCRAEINPAIKWGIKAMEMAKKINDLEIELHAMNNIGTGKMLAGDYSGKNYLQESLGLSIRHDFAEHAARAYDNFGTVYVWNKNLDDSKKYFTLGLNYCNDKDIDTLGLCIAGYRSKTQLYMGEWDEAIDTAGLVLKRENVPLMNKIIPLAVMGIIRARRNDPGAMDILNELNSYRLRIGEVVEMIVSVQAVLAEAFWLQNRLNNIIDEVESVYNMIKDRDNPWAVSELAFWLWRAEKLSEIPNNVVKPYSLQIKGKWKEAAKLWEELKCPYEHALALSEGDEGAMKKSLEIFEQLGAAAPSSLIKQKMRESGIRSIPKGQRKSTKDNPAGLTKRQYEILKLIAEGLSNSKIADILFISRKTVDHHVSAIFSRLNIHSRTEAALLVHSNKLFLKKRERLVI